MNPETHSSGNGPPQRGAPDNSTRLANGLFALAGAGAFLFVLLLAIRNAAPPGLAFFPLSSALVILQVALLTAIFFGLGVALRRGHRLHRPARQLTKRSMWSLLAVCVGVLPALYLLLRTLLPENEFVIPLPFNNDRALFTSLVLMSVLAGTLALLWWRGLWRIRLRVRASILVLVVLAVQLALILLFHGQLPHPMEGDEYYQVANGIRQFQDPGRFITFVPHRNAATWFNFPAAWLLSGAWMHVFGTGLLQGRFFWLLTSWLAVPFTFLVARKLYGRTAALAALALAGFIPLQYNHANSRILVATVTVIALYCWLRAREPGQRRPGLFSLLCGLCASLAVEGHVYGVVFPLLFLVWHTGEFLRGLRKGEGWRQTRFWSFVLGCGLAALLWLAYHVALPGIHLARLPEILRQTWAWEALADAPPLTRPSVLYRVFAAILTQFWLSPAEALLFVLVVIAELWRGRKMNGLLIALCAAGLLVMLVASVSAHFNFYSVFLFPFYCLLFGGLVARLTRQAGIPAKAGVISLGALTLLLAVPALFALQTVEAAHFPPTQARMDFLEAMSAVGRDIDALLPAADIVVAGDRAFYMGMPQRLNFGALFLFGDEPGFLQDDPTRWSLAEPGALILGRGAAAEIPGLNAWLLEREFRVVRCFATPGYGQGTTALWLHPALDAPGGPTNCPADK